MNKKDAFTVIDEVLRERGGEALTAWEVLTAPPSPPGGLGQLATEVANLSRLVAKTGNLAEWQTPPQHSVAMERLAFRVVCVLEAFEKLYNHDAYLPLLVQVWQMIVQDGASAADVHAAIFEWATRDKTLGGALRLRSDKGKTS